MQRMASSLGYGCRGIAADDDQDPFAFAPRVIQAAQPVVFDVGAHHGQTASRLVELFPSARVHRFEPFPVSYGLLEIAARADARVQCHRVCFFDRTGAAMMNCNASTATNSLLDTDLRAAAKRGEGLLDADMRIEVATTTLDAFCSAESIKQIDLLKIDTQGAEYAALEDAATMPARRAVTLFVLEMITAATYARQRLPSEYFSLLESRGYVFSGVFSPMYRHELLAQCDVAFTLRP